MVGLYVLLVLSNEGTVTLSDIFGSDLFGSVIIRLVNDLVIR